MTNFVSRFVKNESGAAAIEYGLIAALIAAVLVAALALIGGRLSNTFGLIANKLP